MAYSFKHKRDKPSTSTVHRFDNEFFEAVDKLKDVNWLTLMQEYTLEQETKEGANEH